MTADRGRRTTENRSIPRSAVRGRRLSRVAVRRLLEHGVIGRNLSYLSLPVVSGAGRRGGGRRRVVSGAVAGAELVSRRRTGRRGAGSVRVVSRTRRRVVVSGAARSSSPGAGFWEAVESAAVGPSPESDGSFFPDGRFVESGVDCRCFRWSRRVWARVAAGVPPYCSVRCVRSVRKGADGPSASDDCCVESADAGLGAAVESGASSAAADASVSAGWGGDAAAVLSVAVSACPREGAWVVSAGFRDGGCGLAASLAESGRAAREVSAVASGRCREFAGDVCAPVVSTLRRGGPRPAVVSPGTWPLDGAPCAVESLSGFEAAVGSVPD
jgi:hypothetical protein